MRVFPSLSLSVCPANWEKPETWRQQTKPSLLTIKRVSGILFEG
jgi:hypothetical protein